MSETTEPSYYEIALTNRQVLVSFVVLLTCVLAAFVSGVWVGRKGVAPVLSAGDQLASAEVAPSDFEQLDEFKFFSDQEEEGDQPAARNELEELVSEPRPETTLAEDLSQEAAPRTAPPPPVAPPRRESTAPPPPPPAVRSAPPPTSQRSVPAPVSAQEGLVIQVLSTRDESRADRILGQLRQGGYKAFLSPVTVGTQVNYRVRIGPFKERPPAEKVAQEVNRKYKLDTWITAASN